jgi:predicted DNA-binding transcriptional regulator YafY
MALMLTLQERGPSTAADLAGRLDVSVRTLYRDVAALQAAGVPLWTETGPGGGIRLLEGWRTRLDGLTGDEAAALALAGVPNAASDLGLGAVMVSAQAKVELTLPPELRARSGRVRERFHLDAPGWFHHPESNEWLAVLADAVWSGRRVDLRYARGDGVVQRRVDPLGLVLKAGVWYLVARVRGDVRTYRVGRVRRARVRAGVVERPSDFDLASWWNASAAAFDRSMLRSTCGLRLSARGLRLLPHVVSVDAAARAIADASEPDGEGWCTVELEVESDEVAAAQLLGLGADVEVCSPAALRDRMHALGVAIADRHATRASA